MSTTQPAGEVFLRGRTCSVRSWRYDDVEALVRHGNNIEIAKWLRDRFPHPYTRGDAIGFLKAAGVGVPSNLAIDVDGEAVGGIGFVRGGDVELFGAEIGYWLGEAMWGRGIATESLVLVTDYAFDTFNLLRLFALPFADNTGSIRVLEKAGYTLEGIVRSSCVKFGTARDQLLYAKINDAWRGALGA